MNSTESGKSTPSESYFDNFKSWKREYTQISPELRDALIQIVCCENITIKDAALRLNMKYSAAKSIIKIYRQTGRSKKLNKKRPIINVI